MVSLEITGGFEVPEYDTGVQPPTGINFITFHFPKPQIIDRISLEWIKVDNNLKSSLGKGVEKDFRDSAGGFHSDN